MSEQSAAGEYITMAEPVTSSENITPYSEMSEDMKQVNRLMKDYYNLPITSFTDAPPAEVTGIYEQLQLSWDTTDPDKRTVDESIYHAAAKTASRLRPGLREGERPRFFGLGRAVRAISDNGQIERNIISQTLDEVSDRKKFAGKEGIQLTQIQAAEATVLTALGLGDPEGAKKLIDEIYAQAPDIADSVVARVTAAASRVYKPGTNKGYTAIELAKERYQNKKEIAEALERFFPNGKYIPRKS